MERHLSTKLPCPKTISPLRYPGGKAELVRHICPLIGPARELREVFTGGGSTSLMALAQAQVQNVWLNDFDENVAAFWDVVINELDSLIARWDDYQVSQNTGNDFQLSLYPPHGTTNALPKAERAFRRLVLSQQCFSGDPQGGVNQSLRVNNKDKIAARLHAAHDLLAGKAKVTQLDFQEVIAAPGDDVVLYVDPPYVKAGGMYRHGFDEADHRRLKEVLWQTPHRWLMSYDDHPLVRELYGDWCDFWVIADYTSGMHLGDKPVRAELLIAPRRGRGRPARGDHDVLNEILSVLIDNEPWRCHRTAHKRHEAWVADGSLFSRLHEHALRLGKMNATKDRARQIQEWLDRADIHR